MVIIFYIIIFFLFIFGIMLITDTSILDYIYFFKRLTQNKKKLPLKKQLKLHKKRKRKSTFIELVKDTKELLKLTKKEYIFSYIILLSVVLAFVGFFAGLILLGNIYVAPIIMFLFLIAPFLYFKLMSNKFQIELNNELETALSIITNSYLRVGGNIIKAIEENVGYLNEPVRSVFEEFLVKATLISSNRKEAIVQLKNGIENEVFHEWVDALIRAEDDTTLKATLIPIVKKFSDIRNVTNEMDIILFNPVKEYYLVLGLYFGIYPLFYMMNKDWYKIVRYDTRGQILFAVVSIFIVRTVYRVIQIQKPVKYRR